MFPRSLRVPRLLAVLLAMILPTTSFAGQGINLSWSNCFGEGLGAQNRNFACDQNTGTNVLVGSFVLASNMPQVIGSEIILQLAASAPTLPDWWQLKNAGTCRSTALAVNFTANPADVVCMDWSNGVAAGGIGAYCTTAFPCPTAPGANAATIKLVNAVAPQFAMDLSGATEYFDFNLEISNVKTAGTGSCAGCSVPVCIVLNSINVVEKGNASQRFLSTPTVPGSNYVTWQGGGVPVTSRGTGCPAATAVRQSTWGAVKSLYR